MKKRLFILFTVLLLCFITACGSDDAEETGTGTTTEAATPTESSGITQPGTGTEITDVPSAAENTDTEWVIYWYLCGSDLETNYGAATTDLNEMLEVELPSNVKVVIQTGGAAVWQNELVCADRLQRYVYDNSGLYLVDEQPSASMGDQTTLAGFLSFAKANYPGKHTAVVLWNHGGGSVSGASFDELYGMDSLSLSELYEAFRSVFGENEENQPVEIIGFDTCLMATIDTAYTFSGIGKYLVASEEVEPGNGWFYSGWLGAVAENPEIEADKLAKIICDTYAEGCERVGTQDSITLSVTNLSKVNELLSAYDDFGKEALAYAYEDPAFFAYFSKIAGNTENYGGNTREQGFTNMADLGNLAAKSSELLPDTSSTVLQALADCVEYKVNGKYRAESNGLSCYYSYNGDVDDLNSYIGVGASTAFKYLYAYGITGGLADEGMEYINMENDSLPERKTLGSEDWEDIPVTVDEEGRSVLTLGCDAAEVLSSVTFELYYADPEDNFMLCLGTDNDIIADWENGVFRDNFRGVWGSIDGALCYMEIAYEGEDYNCYSVPILLNDEECNLMVIYDFTTEEFYIEGARKAIDESGAADKNIRYLKEGDVLQTIHFASSLDDDNDELTAIPVDTVLVTEDTAFSEIELGDGLFIMMYVMQDSLGNTVYSAPVTFISENGEITTSVE